MYTFSATAHWGTRLWQGGELYFNPELASGIPFSTNLVGLGGFTNGEITRAAGSTPKPYVQRLFIRQTWNHGGVSEKIESDFNQMAGTVDKNRFVLTAGNFSTLDVFDDNTYAKDPRTQFMNWGNWTYAAFDYSANARGFGWGFAGELYQDDWVFRFGRMTGPKEPNGLPLDFALGKHYGDQAEVEHAHSINGQPGKVRFLAFRNKAVLASFNHATAYLHANPTTDPQTIFNVRGGEKIKYGLGINVEQAISTDVGFFLRAMKTDGRTETVAFTEVDDSFSSGFLVKGNLWGRVNDTVGLSMMQNRLSTDRRQFLEAGGISFFIGDDKLSYKPETIFEGFYSLGLGKSSWLTGDYQRIQNPAYNASRGPVNVFAVRFHAEF
jgi:high affinity Mn2+ porin